MKQETMRWQWLFELRSYIPLDTKQIISRTLFLANLLVYGSTKETKLNTTKAKNTKTK